MSLSVAKQVSKGRLTDRVIKIPDNVMIAHSERKIA